MGVRLASGQRGQRGRRQGEDKAPDHVGQRRKGQLLFERATSPADDGRTCGRGFFEQLEGEPRFADARFAFQDDQVAAMLERVFQRVTQRRDFLVATDKVVEDRRIRRRQERALRQHVRGGRGSDGLRSGSRADIPHRSDLAVEDLLVNLLCQRAGVRAQFFGQQPAATLIAEQRARAVAHGGLIAHERLIGCLAHGVTRQHLAAGGDGCAEIALIGAQTGQLQLRVDVEFLEPLALVDDPVGIGVARQVVILVEVHGGLQMLDAEGRLLDAPRTFQFLFKNGNV